ncbi:hypothetical protein [Trichodesmium erythraeum]|uniref:hypothetical protein n=1 Tax=Trichodesmium erythraeum TaxID=1206 RepID=UPI0018C8D41C|nr:hypothetical protein [Trichodesmium erythraeum 21-75]
MAFASMTEETSNRIHVLRQYLLPMSYHVSFLPLIKGLFCSLGFFDSMSRTQPNLQSDRSHER